MRRVRQGFDESAQGFYASRGSADDNDTRRRFQSPTDQQVKPGESGCARLMNSVWGGREDPHVRSGCLGLLPVRIWPEHQVILASSKYSQMLFPLKQNASRVRIARGLFGHDGIAKQSYRSLFNAINKHKENDILCLADPISHHLHPVSKGSLKDRFLDDLAHNYLSLVTDLIGPSALSHCGRVLRSTVRGEHPRSYGVNTP